MVTRNPSLNRRQFLGKVFRTIAATSAAPVLLSNVKAQILAPPSSLRLNTEKPLLQESDFKYLGYYSIDCGGEFSYGMGLSHRYVGGEFRFLALTHNPSGNRTAYSLYEIPLPSLNSTTSTLSNQWADIWSGLRGSGNGMWHGLWWNDQTQSLWSTAAVEYPGTSDEETTTKAIALTTLGDNGAVSRVRGLFGLQGIPARRICGGITQVPSWFQSQYGVGPYAIGFGGYMSRMSVGPCSMGPVLITMPDPAFLPDNSDVPSSQSRILMDSSSGTMPAAWYPAADQPSKYDRGVRTADVIEEYDSWQSPAPDGLGRWTWGDSAFQTGIWVDLPHKHGFILIPTVNTGKVFYTNSNLWREGKTAEFQIYDPSDFGEVIRGKKPAWNVKPKSIWRPSQFPKGSPGPGDGISNTVCGATFDPATNRLYARWTFYDGEWPNTRDRIFVWQVG